MLKHIAIVLAAAAITACGEDAVVSTPAVETAPVVAAVTAPVTVAAPVAETTEAAAEVAPVAETTEAAPVVETIEAVATGEVEG